VKTKDRAFQHSAFGAVSSGRDYTLYICTANLGATKDAEGDPILKHCFAKIVDQRGITAATLAFGPAGVSSEPYPDLPSVRCAVQASDLDEMDIQRVSHWFLDCEKTGYSWKENNCCSCVRDTVEQVLGLEVNEMIRVAADQIEQADNPFRE
jgi:hypothetical protein